MTRPISRKLRRYLNMFYLPKLSLVSVFYQSFLSCLVELAIMKSYFSEVNPFATRGHWCPTFTGPQIMNHISKTVDFLLVKLAIFEIYMKFAII